MFLQDQRKANVKEKIQVEKFILLVIVFLSYSHVPSSCVHACMLLGKIYKRQLFNEMYILYITKEIKYSFIFLL